ncbi:MAG: hypothetical protein NZM37_09380, partial [Sandaracinaceae bacterium]|nr:hypothetical protein [Sandaracinaceae bacterium]
EYKRNIFLVVIVSFFLVFLFAWLCDHPEIAGQALMVAGILALAHIGINSIKLSALERSRIGAILILAFFSMLFWAFFEQAGSSLSLFTDRNVDRVNEDRKITPEDIGKEVSIVLTQEQVGYKIDGSLLTIDRLDALRQDAQANQGVVRRRILIEPEHVGMGIGGKEIPAGMFQAVNPIFILIFGLLFTSLWVWLARRNREPTTPTKFLLGLVQIGLGFGVLYFGSLFADERGMVSMGWLVLAYLLHTTGELCLSPVGLSMVTRLAPSGMVATMMGAWYLATAFSQYLAGLIAALAGAQKEGDGGESIPLPKDTLPIYADVFGKVAIAAGVAGALLFVMSPLVVRWMGEQTRNEKKVGVG